GDPFLRRDCRFRALLPEGNECVLWDWSCRAGMAHHHLGPLKLGPVGIELSLLTILARRDGSRQRSDSIWISDCRLHAGFPRNGPTHRRSQALQARTNEAPVPDPV